MADHEIYEDRIALEHVRRQLSTDSEDFPDEILDPRIQVFSCNVHLCHSVKALFEYSD